MKILIAVIMSTCFLIGCGQKLVYDGPEQEYQRCLEEYGKEKAECEEQRRAYGQQREEMPPLDNSAGDPDPGNYGPNEDPGY